MGDRPWLRQMMRRVHESAVVSSNAGRFVLDKVKGTARGMAIGAAARFGTGAVLAGAGALGMAGATTGAAAMAGAVVASGVTGAATGYVAARERYLNKNFNVERLRDEYHVDDLVNTGQAYLSSIHSAHDVNLPDGRTKISDVMRVDYFRQVEKAIAELDALSGEEFVRGNYKEKCQLARDRSNLAALLETKDFLEEAVKHGIEKFVPKTPRNRPPTPAGAVAPVALAPDLNRPLNLGLASELWAKRHEHYNESQAFRDIGLTAKQTDFIKGIKDRRQKAGYKGALYGGTIGAVGSIVAKGIKVWQMAHDGTLKEGLTHLQHPFDTFKRDLGYGAEAGHRYDSATIGHEAMNHAIGDPNTNPDLTDFMKMSNQMIEGISMHDQASLALVDQSLHAHGLPSYEHFTTHGGSNLIDIIKDRIYNDGSIAMDQKDISFGKALYHTLNWWDRKPEGLSLNDWHEQFLHRLDPANHDGLNQLMNPDTYNDVRDQYLHSAADSLQNRGILERTFEDHAVKSIVTDHSAATAADRAGRELFGSYSPYYPLNGGYNGDWYFDPGAYAPAYAGAAAGWLAGQRTAPEALSSTPHTKEEQYFIDNGAKFPEVGIKYKMRKGAIDRWMQGRFKGPLKKGEEFVFEVTGVVGKTAVAVELTKFPPKYTGDKTFTIPVLELADTNQFEWVEERKKKDKETEPAKTKTEQLSELIKKGVFECSPNAASIAGGIGGVPAAGGVAAVPPSPLTIHDMTEPASNIELEVQGILPPAGATWPNTSANAKLIAYRANPAKPLKFQIIGHKKNLTTNEPILEVVVL